VNDDLNQKKPRANEFNGETASQQYQSYGEPQDYQSLNDFFETLLRNDHFLYMLYDPIGTLESQHYSCFYFGISKDLQNRLKYHKAHMKKENLLKWEKFHGLNCLPVVAIVELYRGSLSECEHLERELIRHGELLKLSLTNIQWNDERNIYIESPDTGIYELLMKRGLERGMKYYSNNVKWNAEKLERISAIMKIANAKRRAVPGVLENAAAVMREKRMDEDYRKRGNAVAVEYKQNLPEEADAARRLLAKKANAAGHLRRKKKAVKGYVNAWNWYRQMIGPEIRKELKIANPEMPGPEFGRFWGKICGQRWRGMKIEEKQPFLDREAADKRRYQQEYQLWLESNKDDYEDNEEMVEEAEVLDL
jgi:hypothetical protein